MCTAAPSRSLLFCDERSLLNGSSDVQASTSSTSTTSSSSSLVGVKRRRPDCTSAAEKRRRATSATSILDQVHREEVDSKVDEKFMLNERLVDSLLAREEELAASCFTMKDYFDQVQTLLRPYMRRQVVHWMLEVCDKEATGAEVLALSVHCLDQFLSRVPIYANQLQAVAATCLAVAAKLKMPQPITLSRLSALTDDSVPLGQLFSWELMLLNYLDWDVSVPTAYDMLDQILVRSVDLDEKESCALRAETHDRLLQLFQEHKLSRFPPSIQAGICVVLAVDSSSTLCHAKSSVLRSLSLVVGEDTRAAIESFASEVEPYFVSMRKMGGAAVVELVQTNEYYVAEEQSVSSPSDISICSSEASDITDVFLFDE